MTDLTPVAALSPVPQLETNTIALGGTGNPMNFQAQALLNRDAFRGQIIAEIQEFLALLGDPDNLLGGAKKVGFRGRDVDAKLRDAVSPFDHGAVGNFSHDDTQAVQDALAEAMARRVPLLLDGDFGVTRFVIDGANGLTIEGSGTLTGLGGSPYDAVMVIKNSVDVTHTGRLVISGSFNTQYACGGALYTDNATQCSTIELHGISFAGCQRTWNIGRTTEPDALVSEITISGGYAYGCPGGPVVTGTQTVVNFISPQMITGTNGGSGGWFALDRICLTIKGASVTLTGGESLIVDVATGILFDIQPVGGSAIANQYGSLYVFGTTIETASQLCSIRNPLGIGSLASGRGMFMMSGCPGFHSQDSAPLIQANDDFTGRIVIQPNNISCPSTRVQKDIQVGASTCDIWVAANSLGKGFINNDSGVLGGKLHHDYRTVLNASNTGSEPLVANTQKKLIWTSVSAAGDLGRDSARYSTTTGVFTVGPEGLRDAELFVKVRLSSLVASADFAVFVNNAFFTGTPRYAADGVTGIHQSSIQLGDIAAGAAIDIRITASADCTVNFGSFEFMKINART